MTINLATTDGKAGGAEMTDYNDGKWHLWDGAFDCPNGVHQESLIDQIWHDEHTGQCSMEKDISAKDRAWCNTIKVRVTKPFQEPRVIWVNEYSDGVHCAYDGRNHAQKSAAPHATRIAVRYVETPE